MSDEDKEIEYILNMTEAQLFAEMRDRGLEPEEEARKMAAQFKVIARLTDQNDKLRKMLGATWLRTADYTRRHQAERVAMLTALETYGAHKLSCNIVYWGGSGDCTCGLDKAKRGEP